MATAIDVSRQTHGVDLTAEESNEIWTKVEEQSALMQAATRVTLPGNGVRYNIIDDDYAAQFVDETNPAPAATPKFSHREMRPYKLSYIIPFSKEFVRDRSALYSAVVSRATQGIAKAIDQVVLTGVTTRPSSENFDVLYDAQAVSLGSTPKYKNLADIYATIAKNDGNLTRWLLAPQAISTLIGMTDNNGRPLITSIDASSATVGNILGGAVLKSPWGHKDAVAAGSGGTPKAQPELLGIAGDWSYAYFGTVQGINVAVSDQAAITQGGQLISLWDRDMVALKVTAEIGFICKDKTKFVAITA